MAVLCCARDALHDHNVAVLLSIDLLQCCAAHWVALVVSGWQDSRNVSIACCACAQPPAFQFCIRLLPLLRPVMPAGF